ncbi:MAG: efflux RND transporter permease subunit [Gemmatimonadales bacterium]
MIRASLRRPVAVTMIYSAIALLGIFAWRNIPLEMLPDEQLPRLSLRASWPGASPETVEAFLTAPLEATVQQVEGVETVASTSTENVALIEVEFSRDTDMDFARLDLSERIATLEETLPEGVGRILLEPYVPEEFAEQARPFIEYTFTGPYTLEALRAHLDDVVAPEILQLDGVSVVRVSGGRRRLLDVRLDEDQIAALGLTPPAVREAIAGLDLVREAGAVREGSEQWTITISSRPQGADDVRNAIVTTAGGSPVRVGDVATVDDTYEEAVSFSRIDRRPAVSLAVVREAGANTVRVAEAVKARVAELEPLSPYGARFVLEFDQSEDIEEQLTDLRARALSSALVIFVVLLAFLRSFRAAGLVFATIAFSVLIALNAIYFAGFTLNLLTLMGLAMGFGLIDDNSIVVLENVHRRWQGGEAPTVAAERGTREVVLPIAASTATTLVVFIPFVYMQGELRTFYIPLAIVVVLTLAASLFVSFTFVPALAARVLPSIGRSQAAPRQMGTNAPRPLYIRFYSDLVGFNLRHPWVALFVTALCFGGSYYVFDRYVTTWARWGGGWGPQRSYIDIQIRLPRGSNLERTDQLVQYFEERLAAMPEPEQFTADVQPTYGRIIVTFPDSLENTAVPAALKEQMVAYSYSFTGADVRVYGYGPSFYGGGGGAPNYGIQVLGYNYLQVRDIAEDIGRRLRQLSRVVDVDTNSSAGNFYNRDRASEFVVRVDRDRLAQHGLTVEELVGGVRAAVVGARLGETIKLAGEEVDFDVKLEGNLAMDVLQLQETLIDVPGGRRIRLGDVVSVESREVLSRVRRENQQYERTVAYEFRGPQRLGDVYHEAVIAAVDVPAGYTVRESQRSLFISREERQQIGLVLGLALLLVYMVTAALFESFRQPLCVILTVPMALIGVYLIFFYTGAAFTREAYIGVIMMLGIVVNNAILLVDHVNGVRRHEPELPLQEAIRRGTLERVRPILMTTATTVFGLFPLVLFSGGAGANIWDALALVLIGGLVSSTLFVLTITPAAYYLLERGRVASVPNALVNEGSQSSMAPAPSVLTSDVA